MEYLIEKGFIKTYKGKYKDLIITGRQKKSRNKKRYVPIHIANKLKQQNKKQLKIFWKELNL